MRRDARQGEKDAGINRPIVSRETMLVNLRFVEWNRTIVIPKDLYILHPGKITRAATLSTGALSIFHRESRKSLCRGPGGY